MAHQPLHPSPEATDFHRERTDSSHRSLDREHASATKRACTGFAGRGQTRFAVGRRCDCLYQKVVAA